MALTVVQPGVGGTGTTTFPSPGTNGNVLTSNGTTWVSSAPAAGGVPGASGQVFTSSGTFTIPSGVTKLKITVIGGGGAGGGYTSDGAGGGGAGGTAVAWLSGLTPGATLSVVVGAGGSGGGYYTGGNGGQSYVASGSQSISTISANGGTGGIGNGGGGTAAGGAGGSASGGTYNFTGGAGGDGSSVPCYGLRGPGLGGMSTMGYYTKQPKMVAYNNLYADSNIGYGMGQSGVCGSYTNYTAANSGVVIFEW